MSEQARQEVDMAASVDAIWAILTDFERYPEWVRDLKEVEVLERDAEGRGTLVRFRAAAMGRSVAYVLRYDYAGAPRRLPWVLEQGDIMRVLDGAYSLTASADGASTHLVYELEVDLAVPLPGFVKRRAEQRIIHNALRELDARVAAAAEG